MIGVFVLLTVCALSHAVSVHKPSNKVGNVFELVRHERTIEQIVDTLAQEFVGTDRTLIADEVTELLTRLQTRGLLET